MASTQETVGFDKTLHDVNVALDVLTDTLSGVKGCEYPRLIAREIQALIIACLAHEKARHAPADERRAEMPGRMPETPPRAAEMIRLMVRTLEAREAEISNLRDLLHHGVDTIEAHTLMDPDGTAVMHHGDYQCISATAIEQWLDQAEAALNQARSSTEGDHRPLELRDGLHVVTGGHEPDSRGYCGKCGVRLATIDDPNEPCRAANV
jgi:hypothetical protein